MLKQEFYCRTESEEFSFMANPMQLRFVALVILAEHGAKFIEIRSVDGSTLMMATFDESQPKERQFRFAFPE